MIKVIGTYIKIHEGDVDALKMLFKDIKTFLPIATDLGLAAHPLQSPL